MKFAWMCVVCLFISACSGFTKGGSPTMPDVLAAPSGVDLRPMSLIIGEWTGSETATVGESGMMTAIFDTAVDPTTLLTVRLIWHSSRLNVDYRGTARGTLGSLGITADADNPPIGTRCGYVATASLNAAEDTITGTYTGVGAGVCGTKAGSFVLTRRGPPPCVGVDIVNFPYQDWVAHFPIGFIDPWYPTERGPYQLHIPVGSWAIAAVIGDTHSLKPGETPQTGEMVKFQLFDAEGGSQITASTPDLAEDVDISPLIRLGVMTFTKPIVAVKVLHAGPLPVSEPTDSVYAVNLSYSCPQVTP